MIKCPICDNSDEASIKQSLFPEFFNCGKCGGHFIKEKIAVDYPEEYFEQKEKPSIIARLAIPVLNVFLAGKVRRVKKIIKGKKGAAVLDYGCGAGKLVDALIKKGIDAIGFEPSVGARQITARNNLPVYGEVKTVKDGYDLIMFWQSLEHTDNPLEVIRNAAGYLKKDGKLLIAVPNAGGWEARIFKDKWFHFSYPLHVIQFTPDAAKTMLDEAGFKILNIDYFNPEYTASGIIQTFLNLFLPKDVFYSVISHRRQSGSKIKTISLSILSVFALLIFSPFIVLFWFGELIFKKTGAIVIVAGRDANL
ncbi:MAG: class I SAM-dependent methyltransferase [Parcubacteria group bacterium]|nr:class I SAM-dependent methyltransferase [Parcubacteria group bacterium]